MRKGLAKASNTPPDNKANWLINKELDMIETRYEVNWHYVNEIFTHCSVSPITVIWEGIRTGCKGVSIVAIGSDGRKFYGSPRNYYQTEADAWAAIKAQLTESVAAHEKQIRGLQEQLEAQRRYLKTSIPP